MHLKGTSTPVTDVVPSPLQLPRLLDADFVITAVGGLT